MTFLLGLFNNKFAMYGIAIGFVLLIIGGMITYYKFQIGSLNEKITEQFSTIRTLNANIAVLSSTNETNQKTITSLQNEIHTSSKTSAERLSLKDLEIQSLKNNFRELTRKVEYKTEYKYKDCIIKFKEGDINESNILSDFMRIGS